jgi:drug/metabolite transporter (DMT)-like permease
MPSQSAPRPSPAGRLIFPLLATTLVVCWSSGFVGIRFATEAAPVLTVLFWRSIVSGVLLLPFALMFGPRISARAVAEQALFGFLGMFLYLGGFAIGIAYRVPTGLVALMADLVPLAIAVLSQPMLGQRLTGRQWIGTGIGMAGVLIVSADVLTLGDAPLFAYLLPLAGMLSFGFTTVLQRRMARTQVAIHQSLSLQCLFAALFFGLCAPFAGSIAPPLTAHFAFGVGWLVLFATFGAWGVYYLALRTYTPARVSSVIYLSPPVTMIWAWAMFAEPLSVAMFVGLGVSLLGVSLATSERGA